MLAALAPAETGLNVTESVQLAPAASVVPQVLDNTKSSAWAPVTVMDENDNAALPSLVTVTVLAADAVPGAWLAKASELALNFTAAALLAVPVPVSATVCGEPAALSATLMLAVLAPAETGLNVTESVQLEPAASVVPQVLDNTKSSAWAPVTVMDENDNAALPLLATVTVLAADVVPLGCDAKASELALNFTAAAPPAVPVPVSLTVCGEPVALSEILMPAALAPAETGLNVTERVQLAPAASVAPQVLDNTKSSACAPVNAMELNVKADLLLLVKVTVSAADVVPTDVEAKATLVDDNVRVTGVTVDGQASTRLCALTEPSPVAWS